MSEAAVEVQAADAPDSGPAAESALPPHIEELLAPIPGPVETGEDPLYSDAFYLAKEQIELRQGNDYEAVLENARQVLMETGKDLRAAGYYLLAATYVHGLRGLEDGLALYCGLMERFGRYCFPARDNARRNALQWVDHPKLLAYMEQALEGAAREDVDRVQAAVDRFNELAATLVEPAPEPWTSARAVLEQARRNAPEPVAEAPAPAGDAAGGGEENDPAEEAPAAAAEPRPAPAVELGARPVSEQDFMRRVRELLGYLEDAGDFARAAALARAVQWGGLQLPPQQDGRTRIPAPRAAGMSEIRDNLAQGAHEAAWRLCEAMLMEPGAHISLDLQWLAVQAARGMQRPDLAALVEAETAALLRRLPALPECRYDDGTPFASGETLGWLDGLRSQGTVNLLEKRDSDKLINELVARAREAAGESLVAGLAVLAEPGNFSYRDQFRLRMEQAVLCLQHGRADLALPALDQLMAEAESRHLASWDAELALTLARHQQDALRQALAEAPEEARDDLQRRMAQATAAMCRTDLFHAAQLVEARGAG